MTTCGWIKLHRSILDDPVWTTATVDQKVVLITILLQVNHEPNQWMWKGEKFEVRPGQLVTSLSSLSRMAGVSVQSVRSAIARFEKLNFLTNESTKTGRLISIRKWAAYQSTDVLPNKGVNKAPTKTQQLTRMKEVKEDKHMPEFDQFWEKYPKKVGKQNAIKAWRKINPDPELVTVVMESIEQQKTTEQWQSANGKYIPHPATWLNQRRWEDEIAEDQGSHVSTPTNGLRVY
jgi:hypothetical protein